MKRHVAVVMGGWSSEHAVSMQTGEQVTHALTTLGYTTTPIVLSKTKNLNDLLQQLTPPPQVIFNALHGTGGEDGCIQSLFDSLAIPYTHSKTLSSALAFNKFLTKDIVKTLDVRVPEGLIIPVQALQHCPFQLPISFPMILKPVNNGSTIGVHLLKDVQEFKGFQKLIDQWEYGQDVLLEAYIPGRELTVGVMGNTPLEVTEIHFQQNHDTLFDYRKKYTKGDVQHLLPAPLPKAVYEHALEVSLRVHQRLGCHGITRSDFRYNDKLPGTQGLYFLEINTQPGLTPVSLVPEQAEHRNISFLELVSWIIEDAVSRQI